MATYFKKEPYFLSVSTKITLVQGNAIASTSTENPAPVPTSKSVLDFTIKVKN